MIETRRALAPERASPLRPSEALRLGRMLIPRYTSGVLYLDDGRGNRAVCALGAMAVGYGRDPADLADAFWWPDEAGSRPVRLPCRCWSSPKGWTTAPAVVHLSDCHHPESGCPPAEDDPWPDARIADWLESIGL